MTAVDMYWTGYRRGYDIATARAESRRRLGLPIEPIDAAFDAEGEEEDEDDGG